MDLWKNNHRPLTAGANLIAVTYYHLLENKNDSPEVEVIIEGPPEMSPSFGYSIGLVFEVILYTSLPEKNCLIADLRIRTLKLLRF